MVLPLVSLNEGRFGDEVVGFMEEGGVRELYEAVSIVEVDFPDVISPLDCDSLDLVARKLGLERRRSCEKNGMMRGFLSQSIEREVNCVSVAMNKARKPSRARGGYAFLPNCYGSPRQNEGRTSPVRLGSKSEGGKREQGIGEEKTRERTVLRYSG